MTDHARSDSADGPHQAYDDKSTLAVDGDRRLPTDHLTTRSARVQKPFARYALLVLLVACVAIFSTLLPDSFLTTSNFAALLSGQLPVLLLSLSLCVTLTASEFDLSIGALAGFSSVLVIVLMDDVGLGFVAALTVIVLLGVIVGLTHWLFVVIVGIHSLIVTLGTSTLLAGLALLVTGGGTVSAPQSYYASWLYHAKIVGVPAMVGVMAAVVIALWVYFDHTRAGRNLLFVGQGEAIARLAGLNVSRIRASAFVTGSVMSAICGVVMTAQLGSANPATGNNYLLPAFAAAFLGTTAIRMGRYNPIGTVIAFYLLNAGVTGFLLLGAASWVEKVFNGIALVAAVCFARLITVRQERDNTKGTK